MNANVQGPSAGGVGAGPAKRPLRADAGGGRAGGGAGGGEGGNAPPVALTRAPDIRKRRSNRDPAWRRTVLRSFVLIVVLPLMAGAVYLWQVAADQYASYVGFSVRSETEESASSLLGSLGNMIQSSSSDPDVLAKFLVSHDLVATIDDQLDLRAMWSRHPEDVLFTLRGDGASLEQLLSYWQRMVTVHENAGMIDLRVNAFTPQHAKAIADAVLAASQKMVNDLNDVSRNDMLRYANEDLEQALDRLKTARQALTKFRNDYQMVDPTGDVAGQIGVVTSLQQQLADALIQMGVLQANAQPGDPRIQQVQLRIDVIRDQIANERRKFGSAGSQTEDLSEVVGKYEGLAIDLRYAEQTYTAALAQVETASNDAQRQTRYLATYVQPTLPEKSEYPNRLAWLGVLGLVLLALWGLVLAGLKKSRAAR